jgi:hypothetical protein
VPIVAETDTEALDYALRACGAEAAKAPRIMRIQDTLHLTDVSVSETVLTDLRDRQGVQILGEARAAFNDTGALIAFHES